MREDNCWPGIYSGIVVNTTDPEHRNRITAFVPEVLGPVTESNWAWPCYPSGTSPLLPTPGDSVWFMFEGGDPDLPVWMGSGVGQVTPVPPPTQLGGDLRGTLPSPTVVGLQGRSISPTSPALNQGLVWNGSTWLPQSVILSGAAAGGDLTGTLPNPTVAQIQGTAISSNQSVVLSELQNIVLRTSSGGTAAPGETTVASKAGLYSLNLPTAPPNGTINTIVCRAGSSGTTGPTVGVTILCGGSDTLTHYNTANLTFLALQRGMDVVLQYWSGVQQATPQATPQPGVWYVISGGFPSGALLTDYVFNNVGGITWALTSSATNLFTVDAANLTVSAIGPPSGILDVEIVWWEFVTANATSSILTNVGLFTHGTTTQVGFTHRGVHVVTGTAAGDMGAYQVHRFQLTGLTPGTLYQFDAAASCTQSSGTGTATIFGGTQATGAQGIGQPSMRVMAGMA